MELSLGEFKAEAEVEVRGDPREEISPEDLQAHFEALDRLGRAGEKAADAVLAIGRYRKDIEGLIEKIGYLEDPALEEEQQPQAELKKQAKEVLDELEECEALFHPPSPTKGIVEDHSAASELGTAGWFLSSSRERPTAAMLAQLERGESKLSEALEALKKLEEGSLPDLRTKVDEAGFALLGSY